ncbi:MAG: BrnT family toxin [Alphaproteobacteria bacterium]|nr:BrnT family toxin [Alphaproteobacteria bacterium]
MLIEWDEDKRRRTLDERGLDFADAQLVFRGRHFTRNDDRRDYGEPRRITAGYLGDRFVVLVWTPRGEARRIISMRYGHESEEERWKAEVGRSG